MAISNKRKRVVESDTESDSNPEDRHPLILAQSRFNMLEPSQTIKSQPTDELIDNAENAEKVDAECEGGKQDQDSGGCADTPLAPLSVKEDGSIRLDEGGVELEGEQEYENMADIYGDESDGIGEIEGDDDDDEELGESAFCAICDDGGDLLLCDGPCMRSFHASKESAGQSDSGCRSLRYEQAEVQEMASWLCPNCVHHQHQCFICGQLGKSDGDDKEVFVCDVALCGRFYHPACLAKWKREEKFNGIVDEDAFIRGVKEGVEEFCCPAHKCRRCGDGETEGGDDNSMKLAKCRRCPKAYHKVCLPKRICFDGIGDDPVRAWEIGHDDDPMKRLVMYCLAHPIVEHLSTPARDHLKWPKGSPLFQNSGLKESPSGGDRMSSSPRAKQRKLSKSASISSRQTSGPAEDDADDDIDEIVRRRSLKGTKGSSGSFNKKVSLGDLDVGERRASPRPDTDFGFSSAVRREKSTSHVPKRESPVPLVSPLSKPVIVPKRAAQEKKTVKEYPFAKNTPTSTEGRSDRISDIIQRASLKVTLESVKETLVQPSCYSENRKKTFMPKGELASMLNAIRKAAEKVKNGGSMEDAKRLCPKDLFMHMLKTADMLKVHLAPVLHGMRYTSFGRHFTSPDKLREIVNRIHPYIDSGDMIVDFCCGANDFSIILNEKLMSLGKTCHFKNFDIHPPKNDFCFTKGDWLQNPGEGFLEGKKLIMGLNPPFGVRAQLANRFIVHAMQFRPKLLVLIVPPETMSNGMNFRHSNYDLVWEDKQLLHGHAFYLPGSVDDNDRENMTQWNVVTPPLYLWSTREMLNRHQEIAVRSGHIEVLPPPDPVVVPLRRTPTPTPPSREPSRHLSLSDRRTNSGSTPTECDSSSSRLQYSSATSSQNSLDRPGLSLGDHQGGQTSGDQPLDPAARHQMYLERASSFGRGSLGHTPPPTPGSSQNNHPPAFPLQHSNHQQNPSPGVRGFPSGPDLFANHLNEANQSSSGGNQGQRGHSLPQFPHRSQMLNPPQLYPLEGQQPWPVRHPTNPNLPMTHAFLPHHLLGLPQVWQAPEPHFPGHGLPTPELHFPGLGLPTPETLFPGHGMLPFESGPGPGGHLRRHQQLPPPPPLPSNFRPEGFNRGHQRFERRPRGNHHDGDNGTGGWLE